MKYLYYKNKTFLIISAVTLLYYIPHLLGFRLGMIYEESRDMNAYLLSLQGYLPYRDFEWIYGPFSFFIYPFIMKAFGINLIILRISYVIFASLVIPLSYFLARRIMPHLWAGVAAFLSVIFFDVPYYTYNHIFMVLSALACLLMVSRFIESKKIYNLFWAGIFTAITLLTKPLLSGASLFAAVFLYLLLFNELGPWQQRFRYCLVFMVTTVFLGLLYFLYFYSQTKFKNIPIAHSFFAPNSALLVTQVIQINFDKFSFFLKKFAGIFPIYKIINMASFTDFKQLLYTYFDNLIFCLSFIPSIILIFLFIISNLNKAGRELKEKIYQDKKFLLLFIIFSIFISLESTIITHPMGKAYTTQISFILAVYIFYFLKRINFYGWIITIFFVIFLFYITFFNFYRFPYSIFKRQIRFTAPLSLERARGVFVTVQEKELYESLAAYLSGNLKKEDKIVVVGYYPQFSFLTRQKNIFADHEYIFDKLRVLLKTSVKTESKKSILTSLENELMFKLEKERPKFILDIVLNNLINDSLRDSVYLTSRVKDYIARNYSLDRVFGPADVFGLVGSLGWVNLYKLKGR